VQDVLVTIMSSQILFKLVQIVECVCINSVNKLKASANDANTSAKYQRRKIKSKSAKSVKEIMKRDY